ncbi:MAG: hypothetical protein P4L51_03625 [Puia sp.]|nr:hypothetical protein [Puia sp.]
MKKIIKPTLVFLSIFCSTGQALFAQDAPRSVVKDGDWYFTGAVYTRGDYGYGQVEYSGKKEGVAFIDATGKPAGNVEVPGHVLGIGHTAAGIVAFYTHEWSERFYKRIRTINAALIDKGQQKIVLDKTVYSNPGSDEVMPEIGNDPDGNLQYLLVRSARFHDETDITLSVGFIFLSPGLEVSSRSFASAAVGGMYIGSCAGGNGEVFIVSQANGRLFAEKFDQAGKMLDTLSVAAEFRKGRHFDALTSLDATHPSSLELAVKYIAENKDCTAGLFRFDFGARQALAAVGIALAKDYTMHLKELQSDIRTSRLKFLEDLKPAEVFTQEGRVIVVSNIDYTSSLGIRDVPPKYTSSAGIVTVYDPSLKLVREFVLDKKLECTVNLQRGLGCHFVNGKLYILSAEIPGNGAGISDFCYILDPINLTLDKKKLERVNASGNMVMNPATVLWFPDYFVMSHVSGEHFLGTRWTTTLQKVGYSEVH